MKGSDSSNNSFSKQAFLPKSSTACAAKRER